mgnify:CR=1 FL=1
MIGNGAAPSTLYVFGCKGTHRIYRRSKENAAPCSRCGGDLKLIATVHRAIGESEQQHQYRALSTVPEKVN